MQTKITIRNEAHTCYIDIEGTIGVPEQHQFENSRGGGIVGGGEHTLDGR